MSKNKVKFGIVGLGRLGKTHAEHIANQVPDAELIAACSLSQDELDYAKDELNVEYLYSDYSDMIANEEVDAVAIVSPSGFHPAQIVEAFEAGKHVFCEKPMGITMEEMEHVKEVVNSRPEQVFSLGFMRRFDPSYVYAKELVDNGEIGEITFVRAYGIDPAEGMESFIDFAKASDSGGLFLDMAIHDIDLIRWFTGKEFERVWALGNNIAYPELDELGELETGAALCQLEDNKIGIMVAGRNSAHGYHVETEIYGTEGSIRVANIQEKNLVSVYNADGAVRPTSQNFPERFKVAFLEEIRDFVDCVLEGKPSQITPDDGIESTKVAIACAKALETGEVADVK